MRAVRLYSAGDLRVDTVDTPRTPGKDEVRLKVEVAGICGSDLHNYHTGAWISRSPSIPGHEFCATVLDIGADVFDLAPGDRVVADSRVPCGGCFACTSGTAYLCAQMGFVGEVNNGGFAPYTVQKASQLVKLPSPGVQPEIAVLAEPLAVAMHAVNRLAPQPGDRCLVVGGGTIGALCAVVLRHRGVTDIGLHETNPSRRGSLCGALGLVELDPGAASQSTGDRPALCIDTTGSASAMDMVIDYLPRGARMAVVGLYRDKVAIDLNAIVEGGMTLAGCAAFDDELVEAVTQLVELTPELAKLAVQIIDVESVPAWYQTLSQADSPVQKVIIRH